jgi:membrane-bound inhibitor of C-type lysozyme
MTAIEWNKVTWYSKIFAIILFIAVFFSGFYFGNEFGQLNLKQGMVSDQTTGDPPSPTGSLLPRDTNIINDVIFVCPNNKSIHAVFRSNRTVDLELSDGRAMSLPQAISASGARYANQDESFVFWNKGDTAFVVEQGKTTFEGCSISPSGK